MVMKRILTYIIQLFKLNILTKIMIILLFSILLFSLLKFRKKIKNKFLTFIKMVKVRFSKKIDELKKARNSGKLFRKSMELLWNALKKCFLFIPSLFLLMVTNFLFRGIYALPFVNHQRKRFEKESKPILRFKNPLSVVAMGVIGMILSIGLTSYLVALIRGIIGFIYQMVSSFSLNDLTTNISNPQFNWEIFSVSNLVNIRMFLISPILAFPIFLALSIVSWKSAWINFEQYRDYNSKESGDDEFTPDKKIIEQYKKIPDKKKIYEGYPGIPIIHLTGKTIQGETLKSKMKWRNPKFSDFLSKNIMNLGLSQQPTGYYLIDDDTVNTLIVGMTRSGKGETFVNPTIDIMSRASIPSSMVISDPKGELYQSSYKTLRKRGYEVEVLSFQNMDWSMSYNPLALAIESAKKGYYEKTQTQVNAVAEAIYRKDKPTSGDADYWINSSISLFNAIAMALIDRANETVQNGEDDAWDTITIRNITTFLTELGSEEVLVDGNGTVVDEVPKGAQVLKRTKLTLYFDNLRKTNRKKYSKFREMADINFRSSDFASEETKGNVYSSMLADLQLYLQDDIAKLTSKNSIDLVSVGNPRRLSIKFKDSSVKNQVNTFAHQPVKISIISFEGTGLKRTENILVNRAAGLIDGEGYLNYVIQPKMPNKFKIIVEFSEEFSRQSFEFDATKVYKTKGLKKEIDKFTKKPVLDYVKVTPKEQPKDVLMEISMVYSDSPKAIFLVTPPNRSEYNTIVSFFINQLFNANYETALNAGRKTTIRIQFILDEFANIPAIPKMDEKLSIGLGQNIQFMLILQNLEQLAEKYGKDKAHTMIGNCSINALIKTTSLDTAKEYSALLGNKTITKRTKSTNVLNESNPNISTTNPEQPLMTPTQLLKLQAGEVVIVRGVKAQDKLGRKTTTDPIFASGKTELPYRFMFLQEEFDQSMTLSDIPVNSAHRGLDLKEIAVDPTTTYDNLLKWSNEIGATQGEFGKNGIAKLKGRKIQLGSENQSQNQIRENTTNRVIDSMFNEENDQDIAVLTH